MSELAAEAQVSVGQIYRLFKNKNDIILAIVEDDNIEWLGHIAQIRDDARDGRITLHDAFCRVILTQADDNETLTFEILAEAGRSPEVAQKLGEFCGHYRAVLRDLACLVNDQLRERDLEAVTELIMASLFGLTGRNLSKPDLALEAAAAENARLIIGMLKNAVS